MERRPGLRNLVDADSPRRLGYSPIAASRPASGRSGCRADDRSRLPGSGQLISECAAVGLQVDGNGM